MDKGKRKLFESESDDHDEDGGNFLQLANKPRKSSACDTAPILQPPPSRTMAILSTTEPGMASSSNSAPPLQPPPGGTISRVPQIVHLDKLPVGYRFNPTSRELVFSYLIPKMENPHFLSPQIPKVNINQFHPHELLDGIPERSGFFFSQRDKISESGIRSKRSVGDNIGLWHNNGKPVQIKGPGGKVIAVKNRFVYYIGRSKNEGIKTDYLMKEIVLSEEDKQSARKNETWVVCHVYDSKYDIEKEDDDESVETGNSEARTAETEGISIHAESRPPGDDDESNQVAGSSQRSSFSLDLNATPPTSP